MKPRLFVVAWSELCGDERELVLEQLAEAGREAAREMNAMEGPGRLREEGECFAAYRRAVTRSLGGRWPMSESSVTRDDLRAAAFCVAFADERRRLLGLLPVPTQVSWLVGSVAQAKRLYYASVIVCECWQSRRFRRECARLRALGHSTWESEWILREAVMVRSGATEDAATDAALDAWRRAGDHLALALMRLNLRTAGQGSEMERLFR